MPKIKNTILATLTVLLLPMAANAGAIIGGALLDPTGADQLETWLGIGDQDFTNMWTGTPGVSTATDFHAAVDGVGPTFSISGITLGDETTAQIGGYTSLDWGGATGYQFDSTAFIFNLDTGEAQFAQPLPQYAIYRSSSYFSTFGGGHDIWAGYVVLGMCGNATSTSTHCDGYSYSHSYDRAQGQITIAGDSGLNSGNSGWFRDHWVINSLEVFTHADAANVPEPGTLVLLGMGLAGMGFSRRRKI